MNNSKVSIIIPMYNTQDYIRACLESILRQTYENLELVVVDDGSRDNSFNIVAEMAANDSRIKLVHQENQGVAMARNTGLDNATGDFIMWVDSDDAITDTYVRDMMKNLESSRSEIIITSEKCQTPVTYKQRENIVKNYLLGEITTYLWQTLIPRKYFEGIRFNKIKVGEDALALLQIFCKIDSLTIANIPGYKYTVREGSASNDISYEATTSWLFGVEKQEAIIDKNYPKYNRLMKYKKVKFALYISSLWKDKSGAERDEVMTKMNEIIISDFCQIPFFSISLKQSKNVIQSYMRYKRGIGKCI